VVLDFGISKLSAGSGGTLHASLIVAKKSTLLATSSVVVPGFTFPGHFTAGMKGTLVVQ